MRPWTGVLPRQPVLVFFFSLVVLLAAQSGKLLQDPDIYWHIALGEHIWRTGAFPRVDEFSYTFAGAPWIAKEWLAQLIFYFVHAVAGWPGIVVLTSLVVAAAFTILLNFFAKRLRATVAVVMVMIPFAISVGQFVARPHIFFLLLLAAFTAGLVSAVERQVRPSWWLVPLIALWANLHASFTIAFLILAAFSAEAVMTAPVANRMRTALSWALFGLATVAAVGATPYGYESALVTFSLFGGNEAIRYIGEWHRLEFSGTGILAYLALLLSLAILLTAPKRNIFRLILLLFCAYLMVRYSRFASLFAIVSALSVVGPLVRRFPGLDPRAGQPAGPGERVWSVALTGLVLASLVLAIAIRPRPSADITPAAALKVARRYMAAGPGYNDYNFGGYLISQGVKTFIDGRTDQLFVGGFMYILYETANSKDKQSLLAFLDYYRVTWALVLPNMAVAQKLDQSKDWTKVYQDKIAAVYVKRKRAIPATRP